MRYGFLGPETTFTHQALLQVLHGKRAGEELVPCSSVAAAMGELTAGNLDAVVAPIENSVEGGVSGTLDVLARTGGITIVAEEIVPITFVLAAKKPLSLGDIRAVSSHTHAQAQCQAFVRSRIPQATALPALSTAAAARDVAALDWADPASGTHAAICSPLAAEHFGLEVLEERIEDNPGAQTRFVCVERSGRIPAPTGADKTTIVAYPAHNRAGALLELLEVCSSNGVNLSRIESRPIGDALGRYCFSIDLEGHVENRRVGEALVTLHRLCDSLVFLGSYPRTDGERPTVPEQHADPAYDDARSWVGALRAEVG